MMGIANYYFGLISRVTEIREDVAKLEEAVVHAQKINKLSGTPTTEHIKKIKDAVDNYNSHCEALNNAVRELERAAGIPDDLT